MDEKDLEILSAVASRHTGSVEEIAEATSIPKSTVHYRLKRLQDDGVVRNDLLDVDLESLGVNITVLTEVLAKYERGYHDNVGEKLGRVEGVNQVYFTMGDTDFVAISHMPSRSKVEELVEDFEAIEEVERTSSKFVVKTIKNESRPVNDFTLETLTSSLLDDD